MIFCTVCVGDYWSKKYSSDINKISENNTIYVYTNKPEYFKSSCNIIQYKRKDFSYFEKLVLLFNLIDKHKERVTYFDCDSTYLNQVQLMLNGTHKEFNNETIYSHEIYEYENYPLKTLLRNPSFALLIKVYKELGFENVICRYIHERIISIPYISSKFNELKENVLKVQSIWEENWSIGKKWIGYPIDETGTHECNRWSRYGCGYGEGGALSIYCKQLDINSEKIVPISTLL